MFLHNFTYHMQFYNFKFVYKESCKKPNWGNTVCHKLTLNHTKDISKLNIPNINSNEIYTIYDSYAALCNKEHLI